MKSIGIKSISFFSILKYVIVIIGAILATVPIIVVLLASFKTAP